MWAGFEEGRERKCVRERVRAAEAADCSTYEDQKQVCLWIWNLKGDRLSQRFSEAFWIRRQVYRRGKRVDWSDSVDLFLSHTSPENFRGISCSTSNLLITKDVLSQP